MPEASSLGKEAKEKNGNLPGMGGIYNPVNLALYHYAGNNPIRYVDPDGRQSLEFDVDPPDENWDNILREKDRVEELQGIGPALDFSVMRDSKEEQGREPRNLERDFLTRVEKDPKVMSYFRAANITPVRIRFGMIGKYAVIGRNQPERVEAYGKAIGAETFKPSEKAEKAYKNKDSSLMMKENRDWVDKINKEGYTVIDIGLDPKYENTPTANDKGPYYSMETTQIFGDHD